MVAEVSAVIHALLESDLRRFASSTGLIRSCLVEPGRVLASLSSSCFMLREVSFIMFQEISFTRSIVKFLVEDGVSWIGRDTPKLSRLLTRAVP